jgi:hypothetical protein
VHEAPGHCCALFAPQRRASKDPAQSATRKRNRKDDGFARKDSRAGLCSARSLTVVSYSIPKFQISSRVSKLWLVGALHQFFFSLTLLIQWKQTSAKNSRARSTKNHYDPFSSLIDLGLLLVWYHTKHSVETTFPESKSPW